LGSGRVDNNYTSGNKLESTINIYVRTTNFDDKRTNKYICFSCKKSI